MKKKKHVNANGNVVVPHMLKKRKKRSLLVARRAVPKSHLLQEEIKRKIRQDPNRSIQDENVAVRVPARIKTRIRRKAAVVVIRRNGHRANVRLPVPNWKLNEVSE